MFVDHAKFTIRSGKGGAGCASFRREKFVELGGPDGGDGGNGGNVYFQAQNNTHTLAFYSGKRLLKASNAGPGLWKMPVLSVRQKGRGFSSYRPIWH